jgi:hypothetical protein
VTQEDVAGRVREKHPDLDMGPETLIAAINQAMRDTVPPQG